MAAANYRALSLYHFGGEHRLGIEDFLNKDVQAVVYGSCLFSIVTSIYLFLTGKRDSAIFVGLLAPTVLALGAFWNSETVPGPPSQPEAKSE